MIPEATRYLKATVSLFSPNIFLNASKLSAHGAPSSLQTRRNLRVSHCLAAKVPPPKKPREKVEIPGLEMVTYGDRMHYVPGLAKPVYPPWEMSFKDPRYYRSPPAQEMALYKDKPCYIFNQRTSILEGRLPPPPPLPMIAWFLKKKIIGVSTNKSLVHLSQLAPFSKGKSVYGDFMILFICCFGCFVYSFGVFKGSSSSSERYSLEIKVYWYLRGRTVKVVIVVDLAVDVEMGWIYECFFYYSDQLHLSEHVTFFITVQRTA